MKFIKVSSSLLISLSIVIASAALFTSKANAQYANMAKDMIRTRGRITVQGNISKIYTIREFGTGFVFVGLWCIGNPTCEYVLARGGMIYDRELNDFLINNCNQRGSGVVCIK